MFFQHIYDKTLAHGSYLIGCQATGEAIVIDAKRDVDTYLDLAKQNKLKITHLSETHIHADFLSGTRELAALTGAKMYLSDEGGKDWQYEFDHIGLKHGDNIKVGNLTLEVVHTPGHTPEHISFLLRDHPASDEPVMAITGDFLFVGDVGRPDLLEKAAGIKGTMDKGAEQMHASLNEFRKTPDFVQVWPAHGAGSACGKALGAVPSSTVGYEKVRNWAFQFENNMQEFKDALLDGQPEPPKYFAMMKKLNKVDRPLLTEVPKVKKLSREEVEDGMKKGYNLIDTRLKAEFAKGHIPGSLNMQNNNSLPTWAGWMQNYNDPFMLLVPEDNLEDVTRKLMRIGLDNIMGYITEPFGDMAESKWVDADYVKGKLDDENVQLLDVRNIKEYNEGFLPGATHAFVGTLSDNLDKVEKDKEVIVYCQGGDRASLAESVLKKHGFTNTKNYVGSFGDWKQKNMPVEKLSLIHI